MMTFKDNSVVRSSDIMHPIPNRFSYQKTHNGLVVSYRWLSPLVLFLVPFALFWNLFQVLWYSTNLGYGPKIRALLSELGVAESQLKMFPETSDVNMMFVLFGIPFLLIGIGQIWYVLCLLFNTSYIEATHSEIRVAHRPFFWIGQKTVKASEVDRFWMKEAEQETEDGKKTVYSLNYIDRNNRDHTLMKSLREPLEGLFLKEVLDNFYKKSN